MVIWGEGDDFLLVSLLLYDSRRSQPEKACVIFMYDVHWE